MHRIGEPQDQDELIMEFPENDQLLFWAEMTDDDRYLVVSIVEGTENKNRLWVYPIIGGERSELGSPIKIIDEAVAEFVVAGSDGATLYLRTDLEAEAGRLVAVDLESFNDSGQVRAGGGRRVRTHAVGREGRRRRIHPGVPRRRAAASDPGQPGRFVGSRCRRGWGRGRRAECQARRR